MILNGDCLELMKEIDDDSIDLIFCDLPYGQTSCKWDCCIDLELFWIEVMRIKKLNTPIFFTTTTKFGVSLITSAPKKCFFRYDLIWKKSAPVGHLNAKRAPMRIHEMIYVFYEKLPFYDLSSHKHKFIKEEVIKTNESCNGLYGKEEKKIRYKNAEGKITSETNGKRYDPPLPVSVVKEETGGATDMMKDFTPNKNGNIYDCPDNQEFKGRNGKPRYDPPLPHSLIDIIKPNEDYDKREKKVRNTIKKGENYGKEYLDKKVNYRKYDPTLGGKGAPSHIYDPPLPNSMLEIKSTRGKHSTEKPVALMEWILKYYSKEGDVILDPTMGCGSTGVACKNMNREFIGIEMDKEIFEVAKENLK